MSFLAKWACPPKQDVSAVERAETAPLGLEEDPAGSQATQDAGHDESRCQEARKQKAAIVEHLSGSVDRSGDTEPGHEDKNVLVVTDALRSLTHAVLLCSGHHTHKGQWRKRRE